MVTANGQSESTPFLDPSAHPSKPVVWLTFDSSHNSRHDNVLAMMPAMTPPLLFARLLPLVGLFAIRTHAGVGDAQIGTDHPWYPGELGMSTFERLFATQARQYERVTGITPQSDEDRALAAWLFRNTHYAHGEEGVEDWWAQGFGKGKDTRSREYWTGLFAHGFGLCGTTHSQWTAELQALLGHGRSRGVGVAGHNSLEVFLTGGAYGTGRWAMLDHDLSTVIYDKTGSALLGLDAISADHQTLSDRHHMPDRQHGWLVCGLHPADGASYAAYQVAEYHAGYSGPPPLVHLRRGETLRRYFQPGLEDGKTFVFWGRNYNQGGIPGPERSRTWVNQPEAMHGSKNGTQHVTGQTRFANAVYVYQPDFNGAYQESVVSESADSITFEFHTPYIIAATPPTDSAWGIYEAGCRNGLVLRGAASCAVAVSVDGGHTWKDAGTFKHGLDLTDHVKGHRQYHLRLGAGAKQLLDSGMTITTVCQAAVSVLPRLKDSGTRIEHAVSGHALQSAGPTLAQARPCVIEGGFDTPRVTLQLATPRGEGTRIIHAAAHIASSTAPNPDIKYQIEYSLDSGRTWQPVVRDWQIVRQGVEPPDFWSQSLCYGSVKLPAEVNATTARIRFRNDGGKKYLRAEAHLEYAVPNRDALRVTYAWEDDKGPHQQSHDFTNNSPWDLPTGSAVQTRWVELAPISR